MKTTTFPLSPGYWGDFRVVEWDDSEEQVEAALSPADGDVYVRYADGDTFRVSKNYFLLDQKAQLLS